MRTPLFSALVVVLLCLGSAVEAQESSEYRDAIKLGTAEFQTTNYAEARGQFARAHRLFPNARTLRALGMVEFELKNYGDCIEYLSQALTSDLRPLDKAQRAEVEHLVDRAKGYVAHLSVTVEPEAATVFMDGVPVKLDPGRALVVQVGDHVLEFRAPGRLSEKRVVKVEGGEEGSLRVVLSPPVPAAAPRLVSSSPPASKESGSEPRVKRLYQKPWLWVVVGVVLAGAAAGTAIGLTLNKRSSRSESGDGPTLVAP